MVVRVLLVDDSSAFRVLVRLLLEGHKGFQVVGEAEDGVDAIAKAAKLRPDLVLLDLLMPVMGGVEALPRLRTASPGSRIIVLSVAADQGPLHDARVAGADAFIDKVLDNDAFLQALETAMARSGWSEFREEGLSSATRRAALTRRVRRGLPE